MSDEFHTPTNPDDDHGGKRKGSGRKSAGAKSNYKLAESFINWIERVAVAKGGDAFYMVDTEKKDLTEPLAQIIKDFDIAAFDTPYPALFIASFGYAFGNQQRTEKTFSSMTSMREKMRRKNKPAEPDVQDVDATETE